MYEIFKTEYGWPYNFNFVLFIRFQLLHTNTVLNIMPKKKPNIGTTTTRKAFPHTHSLVFTFQRTQVNGNTF